LAGVLSGLRVIDFGQYIAGPLAAMLLADYGADVVRIDPPGGPRWKTPGNAMWNRGKRSIVLDLKQPDDLAIARKLIATADVVIENFRPGVMSRLGLDAEVICAENPHLIWCALPGFAADDPRAGVPAWEGVLGAATGGYLLRVQAGRDDAGRCLPREDDGRPIYTSTPVSSMFGGCMAAMTIAMALIARQRDGRGQRVEIPLYNATFAAIGNPVWKGKPGTPWMRSYECADGRWIDLMGYNHKLVRTFIKEAGVEHWLDDPFIGNIKRPFRTTPEQAAVLLAKMEALFQTRTAVEWETALNAAGVPAAVCRTTAEWLQAEQALATGAIVAQHDPVLGQTLQPGLLVNLSETPGQIGEAPLPDAHRAEILAELDSRPVPAIPLREPDNRPPLDGLRVIDLGTVLVGPACGRTLAEFGADVIKIDNPDGAGPDLHVSRGKRSMILDLTKPAGQAVMARLADSTDIFLQNFRVGVAEKLGIGDEDLRPRNPGLVYISFSLYGRTGPWALRPGFEAQAQASTGMQERFGGAGPVAKEPLTLNDFCTSLLGAFGVAMALYHRTENGGRGQHVDTSLVLSASMMQSQYLVDYAGKVWNEPRGQHALGSGPLHRAYQARDGWIFIGAREDQVAALDGVPGLAGIAAEQPIRRAMFLIDRIARASREEWIGRLTAAGVGVHTVDAITEVMSLPYVMANELHLRREHPDGGTVATIGAIPRLSRTPPQHGRVLRPTMDAGEILGVVGLGEMLEEFLAEGVVEVRPPRVARPAA